MDHSAILEQTRKNVMTLRKDGVMSAIEATTIVDLVDMAKSRLRGRTTAPTRAASIKVVDTVNVFTTQFPFKARALITHEKGKLDDQSVKDLLFFRSEEIVINGEHDDDYWLGTLQGRTGKVPKAKVERIEKVETVLSYNSNVNDNPPEYTVTADPVPEAIATLEAPRAPAAPAPALAPATAPAPAPVPTPAHAPAPTLALAPAPVPGPSTIRSFNPVPDTAGYATDRNYNPLLSRNTTLPAWSTPSRDASDSRLDLRRFQSTQARRPSPQPAHVPPSQQFNQRYPQAAQPSSPSFAPGPHWQDSVQPPQTYAQRPSSYHPPTSDTYNSSYQMQAPAQPGPGPGPSSYLQSQYPGGPLMPMPPLRGGYNAPQGPSSPVGGFFNPNMGGGGEY